MACVLCLTYKRSSLRETLRALATNERCASSRETPTAALAFRIRAAPASRAIPALRLCQATMSQPKRFLHVRIPTFAGGLQENAGITFADAHFARESKSGQSVAQYTRGLFPSLHGSIRGHERDSS